MLSKRNQVSSVSSAVAASPAMAVSAPERPTWSSLGLGIALAMLGMALMQARPALAQAAPTKTQITVAVAPEFSLGESGLIVATLTDAADNPVAGARIRFVTPAEFAGTVAEVDLGEATTDENGQAQLVHQFRTEGRTEIVARFFGDARHQAVQSSVVATVGGATQLYQPTAGLQIPVFGSWTLAAILLGVWSVYFISLFVVRSIAREAVDNEAPEQAKKA